MIKYTYFIVHDSDENKQDDSMYTKGRKNEESEEVDEGEEIQ